MKHYSNAAIVNKLLLIIIPLWGIFSLTSNVFAQEQNTTQNILQVSPFIINVRLSPNETYTYEITVKNLLNSPLPIRVNKENFEAEDETGEYAFVAESKTSLLSWVEIDTTEFILEPQEEQVITLTVTTPEQIPFGGYHGMLFLEPVLPQTQENASRLSTRVGVLMLANIGTSPNGTTPAQLSQVEIPSILTDKTLSFSFLTQNISLFHFSAKPILYIDPLIGQTAEYHPQEKFIFPGKTRIWNETMDIQNLEWPGFYSAKLGVSVGEGNQIFQTQKFIYFPVQIILTIILVLIAIYLLTFKRKNLEKAFRIFLKEKE